MPCMSKHEMHDWHYHMTIQFCMCMYAVLSGMHMNTGKIKIWDWYWSAFCNTSSRDGKMVKEIQFQGYISQWACTMVLYQLQPPSKAFVNNVHVVLIANNDTVIVQITTCNITHYLLVTCCYLSFPSFCHIRCGMALGIQG